MNNPFSFSSVKIDRLSRTGQRLMPASGFIVTTGRSYFLITNRQVVSGKADSAGEEPATLQTSIHIYGEELEMGATLSLGFRKRGTLPLYDEHGAPQWSELAAHKQLQPSVDIAALPLKIDLTFVNLLGRETGAAHQLRTVIHISAIPISSIDTEVEYTVPDPVYVVGYPHGWPPSAETKFNAAFWRQSTIASETNAMGFTLAHSFCIDPCPLDGMTGSPVIGMKENRPKLLGVYSEASSAAVGVRAGWVWEARLIKELLQNP